MASKGAFTLAWFRRPDAETLPSDVSYMEERSHPGLLDYLKTLWVQAVGKEVLDGTLLEFWSSALFIATVVADRAGAAIGLLRFIEL